jgi:hypothetical protein
MLASNSSLPAAPLVAPATVRAAPAPAPRVVESTTGGTSHETPGSTLAPPGTPIDELAASARQFAEILDSTGNLEIASSVSGFRIGHLDTYG